MRVITSLLLFASLLLWEGIALAATAGSIGETLPGSFGSWSATAAEAPVQPGAFKINPAILDEYGFASAVSRQYARGSDALDVRVIRLKDPTGAYGLYSYLRSPNFHRTDITEHSSIAPGRALILQGSLILDVAGQNVPAVQTDLKTLATAIGAKSNPGPYPTLFDHLPQNGFLGDSDRYILGQATLHEFFPVGDGDWLGFASGVEAEAAKYRLNGEEMILLVADFPTPQAASKTMDSWAGMFNLNGSQKGGAKPLVYAKRSLTLVSLVYRAKSQEQAEALLGKIHSGTELTWNEPAFSLTDPDMGTVIVGIIYGTGILCMFALIAGLAFGGFRLAIKRLLPGMIFDRSSELNVIQLGLGSKPINSDDFYGLGRATRE